VCVTRVSNGYLEVMEKLLILEIAKFSRKMEVLRENTNISAG
jgi:hypothetical protein